MQKTGIYSTMAEARRRPAKGGVVLNDNEMELSESSPTRATDIDPVRAKLRQRWELASVLNFLHLFEPVIENALKISAEDIETALIEQNNTLAQLHMALLKGIVSKIKPLKCSDDWIITLSKTLSMWWPWVATGEFPLTKAKGEEISIYKDLEPETRLLILKALCEVRADQYDAVSYINESVKEKGELSHFQKKKLAGNDSGIAFWYDGNEIIGHRLYKEVQIIKNEGVNSKGNAPAICSKWETLATNREEFKNVVNEFSSSGIQWEVALSRSLGVDVMPVLEKQWKKKQKAQHQKQREQMLLNGLRHSRLTRSCRNQKHIDYRFDNYDKTITEAIQYTNKRKTSEEKLSQLAKRKESTSNENDSSNSSTLKDSESTTTESDTQSNKNKAADDSSGSTHEEYYDEKDDDDVNEKEVHSREQTIQIVSTPHELRLSKRLAGIPGHTLPESVNLGAKNRLRQRPSVNTALESAVALDSEDEGFKKLSEVVHYNIS